MKAALLGLAKPPRRGRAIAVLVVALVAAVLLWYFGLDEWRSATAGLALAAIGLSWVAVPSHDDVRWTEDATMAQDGARRDVAQLSWALRPHRGRVGHGAHSRVQKLAYQRLAQHQLDLADPAHRPAIERLLGSAVYATLRPRSSQSPPRLKDILRCLDALDALDAHTAHQQLTPRHLSKEQ